MRKFAVSERMSLARPSRVQPVWPLAHYPPRAGAATRRGSSITNRAPSAYPSPGDTHFPLFAKSGKWSLARFSPRRTIPPRIVHPKPRISRISFASFRIAPLLTGCAVSPDAGPRIRWRSAIRQVMTARASGESKSFLTAGAIVPQAPIIRPMRAQPCVRFAP